MTQLERWIAKFPFARDSRPAAPPEGTLAGHGDHSTASARPAVEAVESSTVRASCDRSVEYLRAAQDRELGFWVDVLEADSTITSEYLMLRYYLGRSDEAKTRKAIRYLKNTQLPDGGWHLFHGGESNISATVKAYFACKLSGLSIEEPFMQKARQCILHHGGLTRVNVFTKITLALFGQYPWRHIPVMPPEIILLPRRLYFNLYEMSYWSRVVIAPLLILFDKRPHLSLPKAMHLDELYPRPPRRRDYGYPMDPRLVSWRNIFIQLDRMLKGYEQVRPEILRRRAVEKAHRWMLERMKGEGGLGAIYPAMANSIFALRALGYPGDHPLVVKAFREIEEMEVDYGDTVILQPCRSPIWDTCLTINTLLEAGVPSDNPGLRHGAAYLLSRQSAVKGDWALKARKAEPGGWYFQFENAHYPDVDDTAVVLMALAKLDGGEDPALTRGIRRGFRWLLAMQGDDGGWGAYDRNNSRMILNQIPFADHGALLDPSTADLTGRSLELMGILGYDASYPPAARAISFLKRQQEADGSWYGRWGVNYIYGTWSVLAGLRAIGVELRAPTVRKAVSWLIGRQNADGGWGERCESYVDSKLAGIGPSTPSQTAWALLGLLQAGCVDDPSVHRGIRYLVTTQKPDGTWLEEAFTGTGFPRVFYLRYHMYPKYFPLWALSLYESMRKQKASVAEARRAINRSNNRPRP